MKKRVFFLTIITFLIGIGLLGASASLVHAAAGTYTPLAPLNDPTTNKALSTDLPSYISGIFKIALGVAGALAVLMITIGGFRYILAGDNESTVSDAKDQIKSAIY